MTQEHPSINLQDNRQAGRFGASAEDRSTLATDSRVRTSLPPKKRAGRSLSLLAAALVASSLASAQT